MTCLTRYREFTAKLVISSDLIYQIYLAINARKINRNRDNHKNHNTRYNVVHPQCRGYVHRTVFYSTCYKITVLICALSCRSLLVLKIHAHSSRPLCTQLQIFLTSYKIPYAHIAAEVIHAHSWDLTFSLQNSLSFALTFLHLKT